MLAAERDTTIADYADGLLSPLGLTQIAPRIWIDGSAPPARRMFQFALLKGSGMKTMWGYSLDFVPHFSGRDLRWHRTDKNARLDVVVDPRGLKQYSSLFGSDHLRRELEQHLPAAVNRAKETWTRGSSWEGMLEILEEVREPGTYCFGFYNYTQVPLAYAFLSAKVGNLAAAEAELGSYCRLFKISDEIAARLVAHARSLAEAQD